MKKDKNHRYLLVVRDEGSVWADEVERRLAEAGLRSAVTRVRHSDLRPAMLADRRLIIVDRSLAEPVSAMRRRVGAWDAKLVAAMTEADHDDVFATSPYVDTVLFLENDPQLTPERLALLERSYSVLPEDVLRASQNGVVRRWRRESLSEREAETLTLIGDGLTNAQIGRRLGASEAIVRNLVRGVLRKMHFRNRTEAAVYVVKERSAKPN